jgi:hypothetical protein
MVIDWRGIFGFLECGELLNDVAEFFGSGGGCFLFLCVGEVGGCFDRGAVSECGLFGEACLSFWYVFRSGMGILELHLCSSCVGGDLVLIFLWFVTLSVQQNNAIVFAAAKVGVGENKVMALCGMM